MNDEDKTKEQLIDELKSLRLRVAESEKNKAECKIAEEDLRESEDRFGAIFDSSRDGLLLADRETKKFVMGNPAICEMLGYTVEELNQSEVKDIHPEEHLPSVLNRFEELEGRQIEVARDIPVRRKDGSVFYADISGSLPILFKGRESLIVVFRDVTERKQVENALRESEQKYRELVDFLPISVFELDKRGIVTGANRAALEAFGYSDEDVLNGISAFDTLIPEDRERVGKKLQRVLNGESTGDTEYTAMRKDGSTFPVIIFSNPILRDGKVAGVRGAFIDISSRRRAEAALEESKRRLSEIIDFAPDATFAIDKDGKVIAWNRAIEEMTGVKASDILGKGNYEYSLPLYGLRRPQLIDLVFISDKEIEDKYHFVRRVGEIILAEVDAPVKGTNRVLWAKACPLYDNNGTVVGAIESIRDITERKRMEDMLASEHERLISILDGIPIPTFMIDGNRQVILWNRYNEAYTGIPKSSMLRRPLDLSFLFREKASPSLAELMLEMGDDDLIARFGKRGVRKSEVIPNAFESMGRIWIKGEERILTIQAARVLDSKGRVVGVVQTAQDVTERKRAEEALRESESKLNQVISAAQDAIIILDPQGSISLWNESAERILGYTAEEVLGRNLHKLLAPERFHENHDKAFAEFCRSGRGSAVGQVLELAALRKNGEEFPVELSLSSIQLNGEWHAIGILRDITDRKRAQDELVETNEQLELVIARANAMAIEAELANVAKSEFLANMSHEIRTPLNGVIGMTDLLLDTKLTEEQHQFANLARTSGEALLSVINDILDFSKIEAHKLDLEILDFDLRLTLEDTAELLTVKAQEKSLELVCLIDPSVPSVLRGDPGRLRQILVNLVGNAVKFTHRGSVTIRAELQTEDEASALIRFSVSDTGIGIPAGRLEAIFSPFTQVDGSTTRNYGGTGLGLTISKQLVEFMGGQIGVESEESKGSTFWFTALFEKQPEDVQRPLAEPADLHGVRILVVDDHETNRLLVTTLLHTWGCRFSEAVNGESSLSMLRAATRDGDPFQVALLDMQMPEMDGEELGQRIKADPECAQTVLVMMTSLGQRGDAERIKSLGFAAYLTKPIRQAQLHDCLALALGRKQYEQAGAPAGLITRHTVSEAQRSRVTILLAEDNITNQQVALAILKKLGYRADVVANGKEALEALRTVSYDLVLMDCHMPLMDGYEATRRIRDPQSGVGNRDVPIVAMTARAMKGDREECLAAGMNDYITKPVGAQTLAEVLEKWLPRGGKNLQFGSSVSPAKRVPTQISEPKALTVPVFDEAGLLDRCMGDEELVGEIIALFLSDMPNEIQTLRDLLEEGNTESAGAQAHKIKGAATNVGGEALREVAATMEMAGQADDMKRLKSLLSEVEWQFDRLKMAMRP